MKKVKIILTIIALILWPTSVISFIVFVASHHLGCLVPGAFLVSFVSYIVALTITLGLSPTGHCSSL